MTTPERLVHLLRLLAFALLALTGLILAFDLHNLERALFGSPRRMLEIHVAAGLAFSVVTLGGIVLWFRDALFASYDREWVRRLGGYLGYAGEVPAGRFNAGQKMFYWFTALLGPLMLVTGLVLAFKDVFGLNAVFVTSALHSLSGFLLFAGVLAHAYLGTVANPGTWHVLVDGLVPRAWARHHHPNWYRDLVARGELPPDGE